MQLEADKAAAAEAAKEAEAARASLQGEVNTARQRIQAAEKARLELEVGLDVELSAHSVIVHYRGCSLNSVGIGCLEMIGGR